MGGKNLCKICFKKEFKYSCPKCNIEYCSKDCYQNKIHIECSEAFYRECIAQEILPFKNNQNATKEMLEILKRNQNIDIESDNESSLDSDDEPNKEKDLAERLKGIDINDSDRVWKVLNNDEKQEFHRLVINQDVSSVLPNVIWWWENSDENLNNIPKIKTNIVAFETLPTKDPSPFVFYNICNILASYVTMIQYYNGDYFSNCNESVCYLVKLSLNLYQNVNFYSFEQAITSIPHQSQIKGIPLYTNNIIDIENSVKKILIKFNFKNKEKCYLLRALSDIYELLNKSKNLKNKIKNESGEFSKRFPSTSMLDEDILKSSNLKKLIKKLEYYLSYTSSKYCREFNIKI